jgi:hypothetical protein
MGWDKIAREVTLVGVFVAVTGCVMQAQDGESLGTTQLALAGAGSGMGGSSGATLFVASFTEGGTYTGASDATIAKGAPTSNYGSDTACTVDGGSTERSCLLHWDVSSIPTNAIVRLANVRLHVYDGSSATFPLYALKKSWPELSVSWNTQNGSTLWSTAGAKHADDRNATSIGSFVGSVGLHTVTLNATGLAAVQSWVSNAAQNYGIIIANATNTNGIHIRSAEATGSGIVRPTLTVTYELP